jgi:hypothetical protein
MRIVANVTLVDTAVTGVRIPVGTPNLNPQFGNAASSTRTACNHTRAVLP